MSQPILILNGPNLNRLGTRQPEIYGHTSLADVEEMCRKRAEARGHTISFHQSNREYEIIEWIHEGIAGASGIIINPAAFTHTSVAILDALKAVGLPTIEVHLSNIHRREDFRSRSYVSLAAFGVIAGFGRHGYLMALEAMARHLIPVEEV